VEVNFGRWDRRVHIQTFVYVRRRPFHPSRLEAVVKQLPTTITVGGGAAAEASDGGSEAGSSALATAGAAAADVFRSVVRSKGFVWLATFHTAALYWDHSGGHFSLINIGQWWAATDGGLEGHADEFEGEFGDRRQELVFVGAGLDGSAIEAQLDACLLSDQELESYRGHFMLKTIVDKSGTAANSESPGPLPGMPTHVPARSPEDQDLQKRGGGSAGGPGHNDAGGGGGRPHGSSASNDATTKVATAAARHDEGNSAFRLKDYKKAIKLYSQAISLCGSPGAVGGDSAAAGSGGKRAGRRQVRLNIA
jgi:hypothetical protein